MQIPGTKNQSDSELWLHHCWLSWLSWCLEFVSIGINVTLGCMTKSMILFHVILIRPHTSRVESNCFIRDQSLFLVMASTNCIKTPPPLPKKSIGKIVSPPTIVPSNRSLQEDRPPPPPIICYFGLIPLPTPREKNC